MTPSRLYGIWYRNFRMSDLKLPVYVNGKGSPLLMIHGIISDASFFDGISFYLQKDYQLISYDRRGYGAHICGRDEDYSVKVQADDAARILKASTEEPAWILGNSAGGLIAVDLCLRFPELVCGMILLEPSLIFDEDSEKLMDAWNQELNGYLEQKKIKKALVAFSKITGQDSSDSSGGSLQDMKQTYKNLSAFMYGELNEVQRYRPSFDDVRSISIPVTILVTEKGKNTLFAKTSLAGASSLGWPVINVPGFHNTIKDNPAQLAECISDIINNS